LLDLYGHQPYLTEREMAKRVGYKFYNYVSTVKNKILEKRGYLAGPYYYLNFKKISKNHVKRLIIFTMFKKDYSYDLIVKLLKNIESWSFFYPLQESTFNEMMIGIYSTDHDSVIRIFEYFLDKEVLHYYSVYELDDNLYTYNPVFFEKVGKRYRDTKYVTDEFDTEAELKEMHFDPLDCEPIRLSELDSRLLMYLQSGFLKGELSKIMKHNAKIKDENGENPYVWGYNSWRYSYEKLTRENVIRKFYIIYPMPKHFCSYFYIILNGKDIEATKELAANVGANARILRSGGMVRSLNPDDYGEYYWCAHLRSHPLFMHKISTLLEIPKVKSKFIYYCKSVSGHNNDRYPVPYMNYYTEQSISLEDRYYDAKTMTINYDYNSYHERIKDLVER